MSSNKDRTSSPDAHLRFKNWLTRRFSLRLHMMIVLLCTGLSGVFSSGLLSHLGLHSIVARYPIAVCIAYGIFFVLLKIWMTVIFPGHHSQRQGSSPHSSGFRLGNSSSGTSSSGSWGPSESSGIGRFSGGGGQSGGAGASGAWDSETSVPKMAVAIVTPNSSTTTSSGSSSKSSDLGGLVVLLVGAALIFVVLGSAVYFIYQSPIMLEDAAFQFALSAGMIKHSRTVIAGSWETTVLKKTWVPFAIVLIATLIFGFEVEANYPQATNLHQVIEAVSKNSHLFK